MSLYYFIFCIFFKSAWLHSLIPFPLLFSVPESPLELESQLIFDENASLTIFNLFAPTVSFALVFVLNTPIKSSDAFSTYFEKYGLVIRWSFNGNLFNYSIYSSLEDVDCSAIAKHFDQAGGGHKGAAGFTSDKLLFKDGFSYRIKGATINK